MANSILKLKVESEEYNAKLKEAAKGLQHLAEVAHRGAGEMTGLDKAEIEFIKSLGDMETKSRSAAGSVRELEKTYKDLAFIYKNLNDVEKQDEGGKALAASLERLKERLMEGKAQMAEVTKEMNGSDGLKGALDAVAGKFGLNIEQLTKFGGVVAVTTTAVKVVKDAFFQSESNIDSWGRTVEGAKGAYDVFLQTINNGNWSNFFQNLSTAIQGARDLYDALDRLGSIKGNNQAAIAIVQQQIAQLRLMKQQGKDVDDQLKAATANLAALQKQAVTAGKNAGAATMQQTIRNGVNSMGGAYVNDKTIEAAIGGILHKGQAEFDKYKQTVNKFENWSKAQKVTTQVIPDSQGGTYTKTSREFDINLLTKEQQRQYKLAKAITERETEIQKGIAIYAQAVQEGTANAREEFKGNRYALQGSGGGSTGGKGGGTTTTAATEKEVTIQQQIAKLEQEAYTASDERRAEIAKQVQELDKVLAAQKAIRDEVHGTVKEQQMATGISGLTPEMLSMGQADIKKQMQTVELGSEEYNNLADRLIDYNTVTNLMQEAVKSGLEIDEDTREMFANSLLNGIAIPDEVKESFVEELNELRELIGENPLVLNIETGQVTTAAKRVMTEAQKTQQAWNLASQSVNNMGNALNAIDDPSAKAAGTVIKAIADIALGFAQASKAADTTASGWAWLAWLAAGTAAMATTISTVHSLTGFAEGGIVPGNSYSGDNLHTADYGINAGELILNRAQQGVIAEELEGGRGEAIESQPYVTGEQIYLGLNNYLKGAGLGSLVTSNG